jgi:hypothetical protein
MVEIVGVAKVLKEIFDVGVVALLLVAGVIVVVLEDAGDMVFISFCHAIYSAVAFLVPHDVGMSHSNV